MKVQDLFLKLPTENPYDTLKAELIKFAKAFGGIKLGDRKMTQVLHCMQHCLGEKLGTSIATDANSFCELVLQRLLPNVQTVVASMDDAMDLNKLGDMADKVVEVAMTAVFAVMDMKLYMTHPKTSNSGHMPG